MSRGPVVILVVGLANGQRSIHDGTYVVDYDPARPSESTLFPCHLLLSPDRDDAKRFPNAAAAWEFWRTPSGKIRPDGKPDRPLTAFTVEILAPDAVPLMVRP